MAERAAEMTAYKNPEVLATLAAAHAEAGAFSEAVDVATTALELFLKDVDDIPEQTRVKIKEILDKRARVGTIDTKLHHLREKQAELDERMRQTRKNLKALKKNKAARALKGRLAKKLEEYSRETDLVARQIVELTNERMELKVALEEILSDLTLGG